jgi:hypothetical protein
VGNTSLPVHRWFRYSAGFSATWARDILEREKANGRRRVLDPFAGSGTTIIEGERAGFDSIGVEAHPFVARVAKSKLLWRSGIPAFADFANSVLVRAQSHAANIQARPKLLEKCFPAETLNSLIAIRDAWQHMQDGSPASELTWLALMSIVRECSPVGTAQWQYVLPNKSKARPGDPFTAFRSRISLFSSDMSVRQRLPHGPRAELRQEDARKCSSLPGGWADLVITSPPYANNYDYADATRLEMTFAGEIGGWGDLQDAVRKYLVRSCSQHVGPIRSQTQDILSEPLLDPIRDEIFDVCRRLETERETHGGRKTYHTMIAAYFHDMAHVWRALRRAAGDGVLVCFVVGDSAPYGVYVPVDRWLGELAVAAGFRSYSFEKTRDRNTKWKNRKHRVPLHEGRLWVEG